MSQITDQIRAKAEIYHGKDVIKEQTQRLLREVGLPNGMLPLEDADECGYVEETGFVWLKQKKKLDYKFEKVGRHVTYGTEITAYAEPMRIKKLTGIKAKEMMMWLTLTDIHVPSSDPDKVTFKSATAGLSRTFPASAFVAEGGGHESKVKKVEGVNLSRTFPAEALKEDKEEKKKDEKEEKKVVHVKEV